MLVLTRKKDERIIIGDGLIEIMVIDIQGGKVRLGIKAPLDIPVHRSEVYEAIKRELEEKKDAEIANDDAPPGIYNDRNEHWDG